MYIDIEILDLQRYRMHGYGHVYSMCVSSSLCIHVFVCVYLQEDHQCLVVPVDLVSPGDPV